MNTGTAPLSLAKDKRYRAIVEQLEDAVELQWAFAKAADAFLVKGVYVNTLALMRLAKSNADG